MWQKTLFLTTFLSLLGLTSPLAYASKTVTIINSPWQPYYGKNLKNWGVSAEIIKAAFENQGYNVRFKQAMWARSMKLVKQGKESCLATAYHTPERAAEYYFSDGYLESKVAFIKKRSTPNIDWTKLSDFKEKVFVVVKGNSYGKEFDEATYIKRYTTVDETKSLVRHFIRGIGDYVVMDPLVASQLLSGQQFKSKKVEWDTVKKPLSTNQLYIMCSKAIDGMTETLKAFNKGLDTITANGTKNNILRLNRHGPI